MGNSLAGFQTNFSLFLMVLGFAGCQIVRDRWTTLCSCLQQWPSTCNVVESLPAICWQSPIHKNQPLILQHSNSRCLWRCFLCTCDRLWYREWCPMAMSNTGPCNTARGTTPSSYYRYLFPYFPHLYRTFPHILVCLECITAINFEGVNMLCAYSSMGG
jgi:hypothetical protein